MKKVSISYFIVVILSFSCFLPILAQEGFVRGTVVDAFSSKYVVDVEVQLLRPDSSVVATTKSYYSKYSNVFETNEGVHVFYDEKSPTTFQFKLQTEGIYLLQFKKRGYQDLVRPIEVKWSTRQRNIDLGEIGLFPESKELGEAEVKATRLKMVYKGDTLIYNADAFQMEQSAMLGDLVKKLPGVEYRDGRIYAQGKYVESILLSGKDFFKQNPSEALKNLPSFIVSKLKFYEKKGELSETMGKDMHDKSYVMDVHLKKEYIGNWVFKPTVGYGTNDRYKAALFGMRVDDRQMLSVNADLNNLSMTNNITEGGYSFDQQNDRLVTRKAVSSKYHFEESKAFALDLGAAYEHLTTRQLTEQNTENYLDGGNTFQRMERYDRSGRTNIKGHADVTLRPAKGRYINFNYGLDYADDNRCSEERLASYNADPATLVASGILDSTFADKVPAALAPAILNRLSDQSRLRQKQWTHKATGEWQQKWGEGLFKLTGGWDYERDSQELMEHYRLYYPNLDVPTTDFRNRYEDMANKTQFYKAGSQYIWKYIDTPSANGQLDVAYDFSFVNQSKRNSLYRLDRLPGWGADEAPSLGSLPDGAGLLADCLDKANSYDWDSKRQRHQLALNLTHEWMRPDSSWMTVAAVLPVVYSARTFDYRRDDLLYPYKTKDCLFNPALQWTWFPIKSDRYGMNSAWQMLYKLNMTEPSLLLFPTIKDESDPLHVTLGNDALQKMLHHQLTASYTYRKPGTMRSTSVNFNYQGFQHAIAQRVDYNPTTGVQTTRPVNVDGNYMLDGGISFSTPLDKKQQYDFRTSTKVGFSRSADLNSSGEDVSTPVRQETKYLNASQSLSLGYTQMKWGLSLSAEGKWNRISGAGGKGTSDPNLWEASYAAFGYAQLPWQMLFSTSMSYNKMYGYVQDKGRFVWDASLSKTFRKPLTLTLSMNDIFHQQRQLTTALNAWGRTETIARLYRPDYIMLELSYKLNYSRKKK